MESRLGIMETELSTHNEIMAEMCKDDRNIVGAAKTRMGTCHKELYALRLEAFQMHNSIRVKTLHKRIGELLQLAYDKCPEAEWAREPMARTPIIPLRLVTPTGVLLNPLGNVGHKRKRQTRKRNPL